MIIRAAWSRTLSSSRIRRRAGVHHLYRSHRHQPGRPAIATELGLTTIQMGYVFSAFGLSYALLEIPSGWLCDRIGPRRVLTGIVWWSFFTAATGWAWNLQSLLVTRLLFGAGEAGCFPGLAKSFRAWLPRSERPMAEVTPYLIVSLYQFFTWRETFFLFGAIFVSEEDAPSRPDLGPSINGKPPRR